MLVTKRKLPSCAAKTLKLSADFDDKDNANALTCEHAVNFQVVKNRLCSVENFEPLEGAEPNALLAVQNSNGSCISVTEEGICTQKLSFVVGGFANPCWLYFPATKQLVVSDVNCGTFFIYEDGALEHHSEKGYVSMATNLNRLFYLSQDNKIYVTDCRALNSMLGPISVPEKIEKLVEWRGNILAVGDKIYKLEVSDTYENSRLSVLCDGVGRVYPQTVAAADKMVLFFTNKGFFRFDGSKISKVESDRHFGKNFACARAVVYGGRYWLAAPAEGHEVNSVLLSFDLYDMTRVAEYDVKTSYLTAGANWLYLEKDGVTHKLSDGNSALFWKSKKADFGCEKAKKFLRRLKICTKHAVTVEILTETDRQIYHFAGASTPQNVKLHGACRCLQAEIHSDTSMEVSGLEIVAQTFDEVEYGK